jgi:flagellar biosynthesis GTPase FlhF
MFDAIGAATARGIDVVLADTGRCRRRQSLMDELRKIKRVIGKALPGAPHEVLLVLDANTGQNALAQVKAFDVAVGLTGLIVTKLDGSAKGGVVAAIAKHHPVPLRFIGVGEGVDDLRPFVAREFVEALFCRRRRNRVNGERPLASNAAPGGTLRSRDGRTPVSRAGSAGCRAVRGRPLRPSSITLERH